jgi:hypothetical protein
MPASRRPLRLTLAASAAALILAGGLVEPSGSGLRLDLPGDARVEVGAWRAGSLWSAALAQSGPTVTLENVTVKVDALTYRMPRVVVEGSSLSRAEILALIDTKAAEPLHPRLARLSATRVAIPDLTIEQTAKDASAKYRYRNLVLENVTAGKIATGGAESGSFEMKEEGEVAGTGTHGRLTLRDIDLAYAAHLYTETAASPPPELQVLYGLVAVENLTFSEEDVSTVRIGRASATDIRVRPTKPAWGELYRSMAALESGENASKADQARMGSIVGEMFGAMSLGGFELTDISGTDEEDKDSRVTVSRIAYTGGETGETRMEGMAVTSSEGSVRLGLLSFRGFSFKPVIDGLVGMAGKSESEMTAAQLRALVPTIGAVRANDLSMDLPSTSDPEDIRKRNRFGIREMTLEPGPQRNGIPTSLKLNVANVTTELTEDLQETANLKSLAAAGYRSLDLSWTASLAWKEEAKELAIEEIALSGRDMGRISLKGTIGGVGPDVFSPDTAVALVSLLGASAKGLEVSVQENGLVERMMAQDAKTKRKSLDSLRAEYAAMATLGIPMALGGTPQARSLGETVGRFIAKPGTMRVAVTPKDAGGLPATELLTLKDPMALLGRVDLKAALD